MANTDKPSPEEDRKLTSLIGEVFQIAPADKPSPEEEPDDQNPEICLQVSNNILPWLTKEERRQNTVLLDFEPDLVDDETLRLYINILFNPIRVRRGWIKRADWYVGSTGMLVTVNIHNGKITDYTEPRELTAKYEIINGGTRQSTTSLAPQVNAEISGHHLKAKLFSLEYLAGRDCIFNTSYEGPESLLETTVEGDTVKWEFVIPKGERVISNFLRANLYLTCKCRWNQSTKSGYIEVRPDDIQFFNPERKPIGLIKSLFMNFSMWHQGVKIKNKDGFLTNFEEVAS